MRDANVVTLYIVKVTEAIAIIILLSIVGKVFARVVLKRLQVLAEQVYPESQCGFRDNRSTINMIFSLQLLQEKCREQRQPLFVALIDLTIALIWLVGMAPSRSFARSDVHPNLSASSDPSTKT